MKSPKIAHHTEETVVQVIQRLSNAASVCRIAVAFCGGAAHRFFPEDAAKRPQDLKVMVDASDATVKRGLTNPKGLRHILGLTPQLKSLPNLHAKAFIFDQTVAIVGSTNMSRSSIEDQYQLGLETWDSETVQQLIVWFDALWEDATVLDSDEVKRLQQLWRPPQGPFPGRRTKAKLPDWRGTPPEPPPVPSEIKIGVSNTELKRLLAEFKSNKCKYLEVGGTQSCYQIAVENEKHYMQLGKDLRTLWRKRASWNKTDLAKLFDIAHTNGRAAKLLKPAFVKQDPASIAQSIFFLLEGEGDPYVRFEKVLADGSPYKLFGIGESAAAFLMHLWTPQTFAVLNEPINEAFRALKVSFGRNISSRKGQGYHDRTAVVKQIVKLTGLKTFARVDHFLDAIGKGHISRPRT